MKSKSNKIRKSSSNNTKHLNNSVDSSKETVLFLYKNLSLPFRTILFHTASYLLSGNKCIYNDIFFKELSSEINKKHITIPKLAEDVVNIQFDSEKQNGYNEESRKSTMEAIYKMLKRKSTKSQLLPDVCKALSLDETFDNNLLQEQNIFLYSFTQFYDYLSKAGKAAIFYLATALYVDCQVELTHFFK